MPIRQVRYSDIPRIAEILTASFGPDNLFQVLFPYQDQYPQDFRRAQQEHLVQCWWDYSKVLLVSYEIVNEVDGQEEIGPSDTERDALLKSKETKEVITGYAEWERAGPGWEKLWGVWGRWDPRNIILPIIQTYHRIRRYIFPNRAAVHASRSDPNAMTYWNFPQQMFPFVKQHFSPPWRKAHWNLEILAVDPAHHYKGIGRTLVAWGLEKTRGEGIPATVIAANGKEVFYQKCGFEMLVGWACKGTDEHGNENPFAKRGIEGGAILWTKTKEDEETQGENV